MSTADGASRRGTVLVAFAAVLTVGLIVGAIVVLSGNDDETAISRTLTPSTTTEQRADQSTTNAVELGTVSITGDPLAETPPPGVQDPSLGAAVPTLVGTDSAGDPSNVPIAGTPTLVVFVAHWCPHCNDELPVIVEWMKTAAARGVDVIVVLTSIDRNRPNYPPSEWLSGFNFTGTVLVDDADSSAATAYGLTGFPMLVAVRSDETLALRATGEQPVEMLNALGAAAQS